MAAVVKINIRGLTRLEEIIPFLHRALDSAIRTSGPAIARIELDHLRAHIDQTTRRRTGRLYGGATVRVRNVKQGILLTQDFPTTHYTTRSGRSGQYAFILNNSRMFIQNSIRAMLADPQVTKVLQANFTRYIRARQTS